MTLEARKIRLIMELRQSGIGDMRVLSAIERVPREVFVPQLFQDQAYQNRALPLGHGQTISQPLVVAAMTQALGLGERMKVLEIGTGSGYQTAILSRLCLRVYTIERHRVLQKEALLRFERLRLHNITARVGDGTKGWPEQAPFERVLVTAAADQIPTAIVEQMAVDGLMVLPLVTKGGREQHIMRVRRTGGGFDSESLSAVHFVPLVEGALPEEMEWLASRQQSPQG
ncbi:MAG: protein-L-isoaspartate(D-aspartate) O-methyltransferase [Alphaproteobacteria bacterium]|nr:protein-L-isoaspartate(D-aspartate) O-methyltransferase [Alphaproteobacteria bacterium]